MPLFGAPARGSPVGLQACAAPAFLQSIGAIPRWREARPRRNRAPPL